VTPHLKLTGADEVVQRLDHLGADVQAALLATSRTLAAKLQAKVQSAQIQGDGPAGKGLDGLSDGPAASLAATVELGDQSVVARISSSGADAMSFMPDVRRAFAQVAHLSDEPPSARARLGAALQGMADEITSELQQAVVRALQGQTS
jgi:hypothetical protein